MSAIEAVIRRTTARRWAKVARALAYDVWRYEKPNEGAVESAADYIAKVKKAAKLAGFTLVLHEGDDLDA